MKNSFVILIFALFVCIPAFAQQDDLELQNITTSIGKGALSSGYDISLNFANSDSSNGFRVTGNHTRVYLTYSWRVPYITLLATGGFFKNAPWVGPEIIFSPVDFVTTVHWYGVSGGIPENPGWKTNVLIRYNAIILKYKNFSATYALSKFLNDKTDRLPGVAYAGKLNSSWSYTVGIDYTINNQEPLFQFGLKRTF